MKELIYNRVVRQGTLGVPHDLLWYYRSIGLDEQELTVVLLLFGHAQRYSNYYPDLSKIAAIMEVKKSAVQEIIASLMEKECLSVEREFSLDQQDAHYVFSFDPLFKKLGRVLSDQESKQRDAHQNRLQEELQQSVHRTEESAADPLKDKDIFSVFEEEFGKCLSNMERAYLAEWLGGDGYDEQLVLEALRSSVSRNKVSFKYIDAILRDWERKGIRTAKEARAEDQKIARKTSRKTKKRPSRHFEAKDNDGKYDDLVVNLME